MKLGFMSFFVKAAVHALKKYPVLNASVDGNDVVYHGYFDIGIAVGSPRGLVVPILRNADQMTFADIEKKIAEFGVKARDGKLGIEEMTGGTFSISNGGTFGSMMSTPIINPPQSAILGVHATKDRAMVDPYLGFSGRRLHRFDFRRFAHDVFHFLNCHSLLQRMLRAVLDSRRCGAGDPTGGGCGGRWHIGATHQKCDDCG